jgi:hypothetical protein
MNRIDKEGEYMSIRLTVIVVAGICLGFAAGAARAGSIVSLDAVAEDVSVDEAVVVTMQIQFDEPTPGGGLHLVFDEAPNALSAGPLISVDSPPDPLSVEFRSSTVNVIPEPGTLALLASGSVGLLLFGSQSRSRGTRWEEDVRGLLRSARAHSEGRGVDIGWR